MDYCNIIWGQNCKSDTENIYNIQTRALQVILKRRVTKRVLKTQNLLTFENRCNCHMTLLVFKSSRNLAPKYISEILVFSSNDKYSIRSSANKNLIHFRPRTNYMKPTFTYKAAHLWNTFPTDVKLQSKLPSFKGKLKDYLLKNTT
jgi:hypothetical protein